MKIIQIYAILMSQKYPKNKGAQQIHQQRQEVSYIHLIFIAGINELTRTDIFHNSGSAFRLNSSYNNILPNSFFPQSRFSIDEEDSADMTPEDNISKADVYYNYNEILSPYFNRQFTQLTYEGVIDSINSVLSGEK